MIKCSNRIYKLFCKKTAFSFYIVLIIFAYQSNPLLASFQDDSWIFNRQGVNQMKHGNTDQAIASFEKACRLNPFNDVAISNLACAHNNVGVKLVKKHNFVKAIEHFKIAIDQKPEDISVRLNLLSVYVTLKKYAQATEEAEIICKLRPSDTKTLLKVANAYQKLENDCAAQTIYERLIDNNDNNYQAHLALGKLLYKTGNLSEAKYHLKVSNELKPTNNTSEMLKRIEREININDSSNKFQSVHFSLFCPDDFSDDKASEILDILEAAFTEVGNKLNFFPSQRAQVIVFNTADFKKIHDLPNWAGGLYDGKIRLPIPTNNISVKKLKGAFFHEYTHHVVYLLSSGNCPIWLNEGLAQISEFDDFDLDKKVNTKALDSQNFKSINDIDVVFSAIKSKKKAKAFYKEAYLTTRKLIKEFGWNAMHEILVKMSENYKPNLAIEAATHMSLASINKILYTN